MARLDPVLEENYSRAQKRVADLISQQREAPVRGPFALLLHLPDLCEAFANFVDLSLDEKKSILPLRLKELAIITVGRAFGSDYEWFIHAKRAVEFGIDPEVVETLRLNKTPKFLKEDEGCIYATTRELTETRRLSENNYQRALNYFGKEGMVELVTLIGFYHTVSIVLNAFEVEAPEGDPNPLKG